MENTAQRLPRPLRVQSVGEEIANAVTHGLGVVAGIVAFTLLVVFAARRGGVLEMVSAIVYGTTLVLLYTASTLYHSFPWPRVKHVFKVLDHAGIYLLIAGTYTPFTLVTLADDGGWRLFALVWILAITGIAVEAAWVHRPGWLSALIYLGMGWLALLMIGPLRDNLSPTGLWLLVAGGLAYTLGTIFYVLKRVPYMHAVWHLFVLAGSACHVLAVMLAVIPAG
ncbi:MAG: hemolysin III family protein [Coriobacteriia bacterium]|jgi:hemolysin III|nr:hemolysin III family protein [Coriobacteriia bacterium]